MNKTICIYFVGLLMQVQYMKKKNLIKNIEIYNLFLRFIVEVYPLRPPEGAFL